MPIQLCGEITGPEALADTAPAPPWELVETLTLEEIPPTPGVAPCGVYSDYEVYRQTWPDGDVLWGVKDEGGREVLWGSEQRPDRDCIEDALVAACYDDWQPEWER